MNESIIWHGHSNFQIICPTGNLLIDPFFTGNPLATQTLSTILPPDLVLVTHMHGDHAGDAASLCSRFGAELLTGVGTAQALIDQGVPAGQVCNGIGFNIGGTIQRQGFSVTMTEAFHSSEAGVPTGFIIRLPSGFTVYHAGDTGIFSNMQTWGQLYSIDLALLPIGGVFTMDARQAALATAYLCAKTVIPMHYGTFPVLAQNTKEFEEEMDKQNPHCRCVILSPGEKRTLPL